MGSGRGTRRIGRAEHPRRPRRGARAALPAPGRDRALPASADGAGVLVVLNRSAGTSVVRSDPANVLRERLPRAELRFLEPGEEPGAVVAEALARPVPPRIVGVCGGDGSVGAVAHVARAAGVPLLVVPGGTFNHFARTAGVASADDAVDALQAGEGVRADVAELAFGETPPITVLNSASVGVYPDVIALRERLRPRFGKWLAGLLAAERMLRRSEPVAVVVGGRRAEVWALFVGVGRNDRGIHAPLQRRELDDGVLDVRVLHRGSRTGAIAALAFGQRTASVLRRLRLVPERVEAFTSTGLTIDVRPRNGLPPGFVHDGEVALDAPAAASADLSAPGYRTRVRVVPAAMDVYRPAARPVAG
ncbi:diacylglycerol/lipid kinase family protein [Agromyces luteolus]|uniref:diacylglycerol/lipid kinase family protein n=1 Tax=Agromyces luteolus TaxID=88373 RepID=UPI00141291EB|nr:diacylglycerol kinase family protein [Agromyces luteolus]